MKLQTQVPLIKANNQIDYKSQLLLLGSCFVENIGDKLSYYKFQSVQNPFGILFHPLAIENLVSRAIHRNKYTAEDVFFLNDRWHCLDAHSELSANSKDTLLENLNTSLENTYNQIEQATHVVITLGTAWVYEEIESGRIVANCHKIPQNKFAKKLLAVADIQDSLNTTMKHIQSINKKVQFIFTVSPVRHLKDGFVENQQSKSHLITAIHQIVKQSNALYFPSYEIMMDELRDYRFYAEDMVHPNDLAINYIWEKFKTVWISQTSYKTMDDVEVVQKGLLHRPFNPSGDGHQIFLKSIDAKIQTLQNKLPFIKF